MLDALPPSVFVWILILAELMMRSCATHQII